MKKERLILIGGGGHCKSCLDVIYRIDSFDLMGILDMKEKIGSYVLNTEIMGSDDDIPSFVNDETSFLITVGFIRSCETRIRIYDQLVSFGARIATVISPFAVVSSHSKIGQGTVVMHHSIVNADAVIGNNCIINSKALIEHDAVIGDDCHISTGAIINGGVQVGKRSFVGSGTVTKEYISIPENSFVKASSLVTGK